MHHRYNDFLYHWVHFVDAMLTGLLQMKAEPPLSDAANFRPQPWHGQALFFSAKRLLVSQDISFGVRFSYEILQVVCT
jgi:hypothetical protein